MWPVSDVTLTRFAPVSYHFDRSAFKFLPVLGEYLTKAVRGELPPSLAHKWRFRKEYQNQKDAFLGDGSRGGPARRELSEKERATYESRAVAKL